MDLSNIFWTIGFPIRICFKYAIDRAIDILGVEIAPDTIQVLYSPENDLFTEDAFILSLPLLLILVIFIIIAIKYKRIKKKYNKLKIKQLEANKKIDENKKFKQDEVKWKAKAKTELPYKIIESNIEGCECSPLTYEEWKFYRFGLLEVFQPDKYMIMAKVNLREFIEVNTPDKKNYKNKHSYNNIAFTEINWKNVDFLIVDLNTTNIEYAIEYDDSSHKINEKTVENDKFKDALFKKVQIPLIRIPWKKYWDKGNGDIDYLIDEINSQIDIINGSK